MSHGKNSQLRRRRIRDRPRMETYLRDKDGEREKLELDAWVRWASLTIRPRQPS